MKFAARNQALSRDLRKHKTRERNGIVNGDFTSLPLPAPTAAMG